MKKLYVPLLLVLSVLGSAETTVSSLVFYGLVGFCIALISTYYLASNPRIVSERTFILLLLIFLGIYTLSSVIGMITTGFRFDILLFICLCCGLIMLIYIIPKMSSMVDLLYWTSIISAIVGSLGILSLVIGEYNLIITSAMLNRSNEITLFDSAIVAPRIESIMGNENGLAHLTGIGVLSSLILAKIYARTRYYILVFVSLLALIFTGSRGGYLIVLIGVGTMTLLYIERKRDNFNLSKILIHGFFLSSYFYFAIILIFTPDILSEFPVNLAGRVDLWNATYQVITSNILTGTGYTTDPVTTVAQTNGVSIDQEILPAYLYGLSPHNSYLRMFLHTGIVGGFIYIVLLHVVLYKISILDWGIERYTTICFIFVYVVMQHIESFSIVGFNIHSLIFALAIGYGIQNRKMNIDD